MFSKREMAQILVNLILIYPKYNQTELDILAKIKAAYPDFRPKIDSPFTRFWDGLPEPKVSDL